MKLILLIFSAGLILWGLFYDPHFLTIFGAVVFIFAEVFDLLSIYRLAKEYKVGTDIQKVSNKQEITTTLAKWIEGLIVITGLIMILIGTGEENNYILTTGLIIWIGVIIIYFIGGIIVQWVTDLSLKYGYGGWYISRKPRHKRVKQVNYNNL